MKGCGEGPGSPAIRGTRRTNGFLTANMFVPDAQLSVTVLTNGDYANPDRIAHQLARAALGVPLDVPPKGVTVAPAVLATYAAKFDRRLHDGGWQAKQDHAESARKSVRGRSEGTVALRCDS